MSSLSDYMYRWEVLAKQTQYLYVRVLLVYLQHSCFEPAAV